MGFEHKDDEKVPIHHCELGKMVGILDNDETKNEHGDV